MGTIHDSVGMEDVTDMGATGDYDKVPIKDHQTMGERLFEWIQRVQDETDLEIEISYQRSGDLESIDICIRAKL